MLLSLSIVVSLFGIVNTLVLTVFERTRELGMLRAVGMSRRQVRRMIRHESVITALLGAAFGIPLGVIARADGRRRDQLRGVHDPGGTLIVFVIAAVIAGLIAAIFPARRAGRLNVLAGAPVRVAGFASSVSQSAIASRTAPMSPDRLWLPLTRTTVAPRPGRRHPERIALALHDQHRHRDGLELGQPRLLRAPGGCSGNARHSTATAPVSAAVRQATRAPGRPPADDQAAGDQPRRAAPPTTAIQAASSWAAGAGLRLPATR